MYGHRRPSRSDPGGHRILHGVDARAEARTPSRHLGAAAVVGRLPRADPSPPATPGRNRTVSIDHEPRDARRAAIAMAGDAHDGYGMASSPGRRERASSRVRGTGRRGGLPQSHRVGGVERIRPVLVPASRHATPARAHTRGPSPGASLHRVRRNGGRRASRRWAGFYHVRDGLHSANLVRVGHGHLFRSLTAQVRNRE